MQFIVYRAEYKRIEGDGFIGNSLIDERNSLERQLGDYLTTSADGKLRENGFIGQLVAAD